jgi:hypothetical protein
MSDYLIFKIYKSIALVVIVGLYCFFYGLFTGRSPWEVQHDKETAKQGDQSSKEQ